MKTVDLYAIGKCNYNENSGYWIYYLEWNGAVLKRADSCSLNDKISPTKVTLYAIYKALIAVNEPCIIRIHTRANVGLGNVKNSPNKDYIKQIHDVIINAGHQVSWDTDFDNAKIEKWEQENNSKKTKHHVSYKDKMEQQKQDRIRKKQEEQEAYDRYIEQQAMEAKGWREMYSDLMGPSEGCWIQGSGGY